MTDNLERTPDGIGQHEAGAKLDAGKNRLGLVLGGFSLALQAVGEVGTFGANKYTDNGWKSVGNGVERYTDALLRHQLSELAGEMTDPDSEMLHAAHLAWNALARLELILQDSQPPAGLDIDFGDSLDAAFVGMRGVCKDQLIRVLLKNISEGAEGNSQ